MKTTRRAAIPLVPVALVVVIVIIAGAFGYYFITASGTISSQSSQISSQSSVVSAQSNQISSLGSVVSSQSSQVSTQSAQISSQSGQISAQTAQIATQAALIAADNTQIANLTSKVNSLKMQVAADQAKIQTLTTGYAVANATITSLNSQIASLNTEISALDSQIAGLQAQVSILQSITGLSSSTTEVNAQFFYTTGNALVVTFTANYAGYVAMTVTSASDYSNEGGTIHITYALNVNSPYYSGIYIPSQGFFYPFGGIPDTLIFPVTPGTITLYLGTSDLTQQSATLSVIYYY